MAITTEKEKEIYKNILNQLGGNKFNVMTGAYNHTMSTGEYFNFACRFKGSKKANYIEIKLNSNDLYDIKFYKIGKIKCLCVKTFENISCDNLKSTFESFTGLYTSL